MNVLDGPVRTVTTTRQEIVPGVYGRVIVGEDIMGEITIGFNESVCGQSLLTLDDLIAARDVFNQLIDALEQ